MKAKQEVNENLGQESLPSIVSCPKERKIAGSPNKLQSSSIDFNSMHQEEEENIFLSWKKKKKKTLHMYGEVLVKHLSKKGVISKLPFWYMPPMNQIDRKQHYLGLWWQISRLRKTSDMNLYQASYYVPEEEENPGSSNQLLFLQSILTSCIRKERKPFLKKRKAHMYHEVLVKHLSKIKRCYQRTPIVISLPWIR